MRDLHTPSDLTSLKPADLAGFTVEHHPVIGSTNDRALELARQGQDRVWVVADQQQGGRGRNGRVWTSEAGNLYASLSLVDPCQMPVSPQLGFVAGLAVFDAVQDLTGCGTRLKIKWPNDLLLDGAKLSGLLLEGGSSGRNFVMTVGIGLNLVTHPADTAYRATDLGQSGYGVERNTAFSALCRSFRGWMDRWDRGQGFALIRQAWLERAAFLGEPISVTASGRPVQGFFEKLDAQGRLVIATQQGSIVVDAGDLYPLDKELASSQGF